MSYMSDELICMRLPGWKGAIDDRCDQAEDDYRRACERGDRDTQERARAAYLRGLDLYVSAVGLDDFGI